MIREHYQITGKYIEAPYSPPIDRITAANEVSLVLWPPRSSPARTAPTGRALRSVEIPTRFHLPACLASRNAVEREEVPRGHIPSAQLDPDEFSVENCGRQWDFDWFDQAKVRLKPSAPRSVVVPAWELPFTALEEQNFVRIWDPASVESCWKEPKILVQHHGCVGPPKDFVRESVNNRPFRPGGLVDSPSERSLPEGAQNGDWCARLLMVVFLRLPPSFKKGVDLGYLKERLCHWKHAENWIPTAQNVSEENLVSYCLTN